MLRILINRQVRRDDGNIYKAQRENIDRFFSTGKMTEYRKQFMSPRREDYSPHVALPKINAGRPPSRSRSFLSFDVDQNTTSSASEYRFRYPNHQPKRPFVHHAQPSHVFDFAPMPVNTNPHSRQELSPSFSKDTEYHERFPNYRATVPLQDLMPPHLSASPDLPSATQLKRERMTRSQFFHELALDNEKFQGSQRQVGHTEQRAAFQWPYHPQQKPTAHSYSNLNLFETIPPIQRFSFIK